MLILPKNFMFPEGEEMTRFNLKKARNFQLKFGDDPQDVLVHKGRSWVPLTDFDELFNWYREALNHIERLKKRSKKNKKPSRN